jgi:hypothetical protein
MAAPPPAGRSFHALYQFLIPRPDHHPVAANLASRQVQSGDSATTSAFGVVVLRRPAAREIPGQPAVRAARSRRSSAGAGSGLRDSVLGHPIRCPRSRFSAVTSTDRTTIVSSRMPNVTVKPTSVSVVSGIVASTANVAASTESAEVIKADAVEDPEPGRSAVSTVGSQPRTRRAGRRCWRSRQRLEARPVLAWSACHSRSAPAALCASLSAAGPRRLRVPSCPIRAQHRDRRGLPSRSMSSARPIVRASSGRTPAIRLTTTQACISEAGTAVAAGHASPASERAPVVPGCGYRVFDQCFKKAV